MPVSWSFRDFWIKQGQWPRKIGISQAIIRTLTYPGASWERTEASLGAPWSATLDRSSGSLARHIPEGGPGRGGPNPQSLKQDRELCWLKMKSLYYWWNLSNHIFKRKCPHSTDGIRCDRSTYYKEILFFNLVVTMNLSIQLSRALVSRLQKCTIHATLLAF